MHDFWTAKIAIAQFYLQHLLPKCRTMPRVHPRRFGRENATGCRSVLTTMPARQATLTHLQRRHSDLYAIACDAAEGGAINCSSP
jgi:hypothetical protein